MNYELVENTLKSILLTNVRITSKKRTLGVGKILLYEIKDFNIKLIFDNSKKVDILYPFNIIEKNNIVYFDYTTEHIHRNDVVQQVRTKQMIKNKKNKYYDLLVSIEKI